MEDSLASSRGRRPRRSRRPERQQILLRRGIALGGALVLLILIVLGVKGCLDARARSALSSYAGDVTQIVNETQQTSKRLFGKLNEPGELSVTDFVAEVEADRGAMDSYTSRVESLSAPGDMAHAQNGLELVYELRSDAMDEIANKMSTALGDIGSKQATAAITAQMQKLLASDVLYAQVVRPEINGVLADNGLEGDDVPKSVFLPEGTTWLDESTVSAALGAVSGSSGEVTSGVHGLGLIGTSINGTELSPEAPTGVVAEGAPEVEIEVQNQGESTENSIGVSVTANGTTVKGTIDSIGAGETETVAIPLTPAPSGEVTLEVEVETVPGEQVSENNEAGYAVLFE